MVIEGDEDRRLAIELDGDQYHTPERWADDFKRQRVLERVGWRFWRCWCSSFILDPEGCMEDLLKTLDSLGIMPIESEIRSAVYTEHRIISPEKCKEDEEEDVIRVSIKSALEQMPLYFTKKKELRIEEEESVVEAKSFGFVPLEAQKDSFVEIRDRVLISYNDEPTLQHTIKISDTEHDPDLNIIRADMPIAQALIDEEINQEVEIPVGGKIRTVTIIGIEKASKQASEAA